MIKRNSKKIDGDNNLNMEEVVHYCVWLFSDVDYTCR
jgi:hypothetical protein